MFNWRTGKSDIWMSVLGYYARQIKHESTTVPVYGEETPTHYLLNCIDLIDSLNILSPIQVIDTLSKDVSIPIDLLKPYLLKTIQQQKSDYETNNKLFMSYCEDVRGMKDEISQLEGDVIFQSSHCTKCKQALSAPSVHFFCKHSYHKRFLSFTR